MDAATRRFLFSHDEHLDRDILITVDQSAPKCMSHQQVRSAWKQLVSRAGLEEHSDVHAAAGQHGHMAVLTSLCVHLLLVTCCLTAAAVRKTFFANS